MKLEDEIGLAQVFVEVRRHSPSYSNYIGFKTTERMQEDIDRARRWLKWCYQEGVELQCPSKNDGTLRNN